MKALTASAVLLSLSSTVYAKSSIAKTCPETNLCYSLNIPKTTADSGNGDIYFQISAPTSYQWVALGQGSSMTDANIFVVYTSGDGRNVTVSPRLGTGHVEPQHDTSAKIQVLAGSGVSNGMMTANVKCSNCNSWQGGNMDFTTSNGDWIYASKTGRALASDDLEETINRHSNASPFQWNMATAKGGENVNPFVDNAVSTSTRPGSSSTPTASTGPSSTPTASTGPSSTSTNNVNDGSASFSNNNAPFGGDSELGDRLITIHGVLAALAFVAVFPIGGILIRIASFTGLIWIHAGLQLLAYAIYIIAFGMGIYLATELDLMSNSHPIVGIIIFVILLTQPITGLIHHKLFKSTGGRRTVSSYFHLYIGRLAIVLGLINGGKGLNLASASSGAKTAYAVCAALMGLIYVGCVIIGELKKSRQSARVNVHDNPRHQLGSKDGYHGSEQPPISLTEHVGGKERR